MLRPFKSNKQGAGTANFTGKNKPIESSLDATPSNLWVGNLAADVSDSDLRSLFEKHGGVDSVTCYPSRNYAFIYLKRAEDAKRAKDALQGVVLRGNPLKIDFAKPAKPCKTLWVSGISPSISKEALEEEFAKFGQIEDFKFIRDKNTVYIDYVTLEDASKALKAMHGKKKGGSLIRVDYLRSHPKRDQGPDFHEPKEGQHFRNMGPLDSPWLPQDPVRNYPDPLYHGPKRPQHILPLEGRKLDGEQPSNVLFISYPPVVRIDEQMLHNAMILFGEIEKIRSFPSRYHSFVEFRSVEEAQRAKEGLQGKLFNDPRISITFSTNEVTPIQDFSGFLPGVKGPRPDALFNELPFQAAHLDVFGQPLVPNGFHGRLTRPDISMRPFAPPGSFEPILPGPEFGVSDPNPFNPLGGLNRMLSSPTNRMLSSPSSHINPPTRPVPGTWDVFDASQVHREPKRFKTDGDMPLKEMNGQDQTYRGIPQVKGVGPSNTRFAAGRHDIEPSPGTWDVFDASQVHRELKRYRNDGAMPLNEMNGQDQTYRGVPAVPQVKGVGPSNTRFATGSPDIDPTRWDVFDASQIQREPKRFRNDGAMPLNEMNGRILPTDQTYRGVPVPQVKGVGPSNTRFPTGSPDIEPASGTWDVFDANQIEREPKRFRIDGAMPLKEVSNLDQTYRGVPQVKGVGPSNTRFTTGSPDVDGPDVDYMWRGVIAKGGTPVCHARCVPVGDWIGYEIPETVNCSARTGLDTLAKHYTDAIGFDIIFFLPDSEDDFASYTEFLRYLGDRNRAGVAKFDDGTTLFLVPPSEFLTKVLKVSGPERLYGVVLKFPQYPSDNKPSITEPQYIDKPHVPSQIEYDFTPHGHDDKIIQKNYNDVSHDYPISNPNPQPVPLVPPVAATSTPLAGLSLTPELIASLASLAKVNSIGQQQPSNNNNNTVAEPVLTSVVSDAKPFQVTGNFTQQAGNPFQSQGYSSNIAEKSHVQDLTQGGHFAVPSQQYQPDYVHDMRTVSGFEQPGSNVYEPQNIDNSGQMQQMQSPFYGAGQQTSQFDADKNERYQSTLQFAANLLLQIHQKQPGTESGQMDRNH